MAQEGVWFRGRRMVQRKAYGSGRRMAQEGVWLRKASLITLSSKSYPERYTVPWSYRLYTSGWMNPPKAALADDWGRHVA